MQLDQKAEGEGTIEDILLLNSNEHGTDTSTENEIFSWVQQNIIRLSKEFGGLNDPSKRLQIKNMMNTWRADVYCFRVSKINGDISGIVKDLWANKKVKYAQLEARGTRGGIIILWDSSIWEGEVCEVRVYNITCKFTGKAQDLGWHFSGVYAPK
ncbi:hypothetical protein H5410_033837 [Solanum commersonii]|uniref:Uncharacterized protein n=1 Tax=Solanum commersonii TaxID=4109 RepID=A0A9J5YNY7_SOLCO|nr:hypothetical protein H5410_033837 [Solanum commersonii]